MSILRAFAELALGIEQTAQLFVAGAGIVPAELGASIPHARARPRPKALAAESCYVSVVVSAPRKPSLDELIARLNDLPEGQKGEIIDGELFVQPRPRFRHARVTGFLTRHIGGAFDFDDGGPGGWWIVPEPGIELPDAPEVSPDVGGWRRDRMPEPPPEGEPLRLAPDWVCEVLSPSNRRWDLTKKFPFYARVGVPWLWVVDPPAETVSVRALERGAWKIVREAVGAETVALEPFAAVELPLGRLWLPRKPA